MGQMRTLYKGGDWKCSRDIVLRACLHGLSVPSHPCVPRGPRAIGLAV